MILPVLYSNYFIFISVAAGMEEVFVSFGLLLFSSSTDFLTSRIAMCAILFCALEKNDILNSTS